jgi:polyisoprenoid-binding protein YceI
VLEEHDVVVGARCGDGVPDLRQRVSVRGTIDRTDFGLTWQQRLQGGGLLVGEKVRILLDVSAVRAA